MSTTLMDQLAELRPNASWTDGEDNRILADVLAADRTPMRADLHLVRVRHRRRAVTIAGVAAAAAAAAVAVPAILPADAPGSASPAAAAALHRLAAVAAATPGDEVGPGQYLHMVEQDMQTGMMGDGTSLKDGKHYEIHGTDTRRLESWTSNDGHVWRHDLNHWGSIGKDEEDYFLFDPGTDSTGYPSPAFLKSLPTDPTALGDWLRHHVTGSSSKDEAVFVAVGDMLRGGFAPAALRSAALQVLADTGHVSLGDETRDELGRPAVEFDFIDNSIRKNEVQSLFFDPDTAQILEERDVNPAFAAHTIVAKADVVDEVPAVVRDKAIEQH